MTEIRWHGRGGQGAKTVSELLAMAQLAAGQSVQAFPEYGPERSGAPVQAYNRSADRPIRRRHAVTEADAVVVLDESLLAEVEVAAGLKADGLLLVNTGLDNFDVGVWTGFRGRILCVPGDALAAAVGARYANVVLLGALAGALGEPPLEALVEAARELLGRKLAEDGLTATLAAIGAGHAAAVGGEAAWLS